MESRHVNSKIIKAGHLFLMSCILLLPRLVLSQTNTIVSTSGKVNFSSEAPLDNEGNIRFTGRNSGLFKFDGNVFKHYGIKKGLYDNKILNIWADGKGNLLLTFDYAGLWYVNPEAVMYQYQLAGYAKEDAEKPANSFNHRSKANHHQLDQRRAYLQ